MATLSVELEIYFLTRNDSSVSQLGPAVLAPRSWPPRYWAG